MSRHAEYRQGAATKNANDPADVRRAKRAEDLAAEQDAKDLEQLLATPAFRRFAWRLVVVSKLEADVWDPSSRIHFNAGTQAVGIWFRDQVDLLDPTHYGKLRAEAIRRTRTMLEQLEASRTNGATNGRVQDDAVEQE